MKGLPYIYERLRPFKLDEDDKSCVCADYCGVSPDVVDDAGLSERDLKALPRETYLGLDFTSKPNGQVSSVSHVFSKSALGAHIAGEL